MTAGQTPDQQRPWMEQVEEDGWMDDVLLHQSHNLEGEAI